ncbi:MULTISPECIES: hypothetical protein [Streptomyces]|uniref:hypothetical protein n=1 Tax=Streptomyces TaxID=1883 RepID=UPI001315E441|nr:MULTISPECIES: hypothetical protein [Streptomyces]QGZ48335.1 hypothetical protein GPZ77_07990 [Streptomyces sp. QHH-9511]GGT66093.1 hypothetical protein GCM10010272_05790 [Streptomyces lateritius]
MTQTLPLPGTATGRPTPARRILRALAVVACVPYISLKVAWVAGSEIGIPPGSVLLDHRALLIVANSVSVVMDAMVVLLALLLTQPWGLRVRAWLLAFPMWAATGLLSPIMVGFPAQLVLSVFAGPQKHESGGRPFLDEWVFGAVYGGFIGQGLALGALFLLYTRDRWGHVWRGTLDDLPARLSGTAVRVTAVVASLLALAPCAVRLMWALGSTHGLSAGQISQRTEEFHLLEWMRLLFTAVAVVTVLMLVFAGTSGRRTGALPVRTPLGLAWVATGGVGCWGAYMTLVTFLPDTDPDKAFTGLARLTYAGEMITGFLLAACVAAFLRRRSASA